MLLLILMGFHVVADAAYVVVVQPYSLLYVQVTVWCLLLSVYLLRFMMLGSDINRKYQSTSLLLTEQVITSFILYHENNIN